MALQTLLLATIPLILALLFKFVIQPAYFSPLSKIPAAHWSASLSNIWIKYFRVSHYETIKVHEAHVKYGPVIRLAPNEISVNCIDGGVRAIYSGGYEKGRFYTSVMTNFNIPPMFAMESRKAHTERKRMISHIYAKSTLQNSPSVTALFKITMQDRMLPLLQSFSKQDKPVEIFDVFTAITMDVVCGYIFGLAQGSNLLGDMQYTNRLIRLFKERTRAAVWPQEVPVLANLIRAAGLGWLIKAKTDQQGMTDAEPWILSMCDKAERVLQDQKVKPNAEHPEDYPSAYAHLRASMLREHQKSTDWSDEAILAANRLQIASEFVDHTFAGFDTSGTTLTWLAHNLSKKCNAQWQSQLQQETRRVQDLSDLQVLDNLEVLHAVLMETLRLHAAIPGNQPRQTPANAVIGSPGHEYFNIPANVRIQAQAHSLHRNEDVFPDSESWLPERWLDSSPERLKEMHRWFWAFGSGGRMCVGSNLAMLEMKAIIATIWSNFYTRIAFDEGMVANHGYSAEPLGKDGRILELFLDPIPDHRDEDGKVHT